MTDFQAFWSNYPRKTGKLYAMRCYQKALKIAKHDEIMAGLAQYNLHLPEELQFVPHASTWLNQGRWMDEYEEIERKPVQSKSTLKAIDGMRDFLRASNE